MRFLVKFCNFCSWLTDVSRNVILGALRGTFWGFKSRILENEYPHLAMNNGFKSHFIRTRPAEVKYLGY